MPDPRVLDILKQVEKGDMSPEEADRALADLAQAVGAAATETPDPTRATAAPVPPPPPRWPAGLPGGDRMRARMEKQRVRMERQRAQMERRIAHRQARYERIALRRTTGGFTVDHLISLRLHGITSDYVEEMREAGYDDVSPEELIELRIHGVSPDYVAEMREVLGDVPVDKMIEFRIHGVTADLVQELQESGVETPTPDDVLRWRQTTGGSRLGDAWSTAREAVGPHVTQLVEAALAEARTRIYEALRVDPEPPEAWSSVQTSAAAAPPVPPATPATPKPPKTPKTPAGE